MAVASASSARRPLRLVARRSGFCLRSFFARIRSELMGTREEHGEPRAVAGCGNRPDSCWAAGEVYVWADLWGVLRQTATTQATEVYQV